MTKLIAAAVLALATVLAGTALAGPGREARIKSLASPMDPTRETVLVGRSLEEDIIVQLELEPAKAMWMASTTSVQLEMQASKGTWVVAMTPPQWSEHVVEEGELFYVEVKPIDPDSKARIPYAAVKFRAVNRDNEQRVRGDLHPMWGQSGLHYALNSGLAGDGTYAVVVTVEVPTFARDMKDKFRWMEPRSARFHLKLVGGKVTEVTESDLY